MQDGKAMNARTAKLIRKFSVKTGATIRSTKRGWNKTPRNERGENRKAMREEIK